MFEEKLAFSFQARESIDASTNLEEENDSLRELRRLRTQALEIVLKAK